MAMTGEQMQVVIHDGGHAVVGAVAGSGKSTTMVHRIVHLLKHGAEPDSILVMMFNKTAQQDFKKRLFRQLKKKPLVDSLKVKTFHSFGLELLTTFVEEGLLPPAKLLTHEWEVAALARESLAYANGMVADEERVDIDNEVVAELLSLIDLAKSNLFEAEDLRLEVPSKVYRDAFRAFEELRKERELRTFADLIFDPTKLLVSGTGQVRDRALKIASNRYKHIILDEYQDINEGQQALVKVVAGTTAKVMAVGDEDQCLVPGTRIAVPEGARAIEDLKVGDLVLSSYGRGNLAAARITDVFSKAFVGIGIKITTATGREIITTPEHTHFAGYKDGVVRHASRGTITLTLCASSKGRGNPQHSLSIVGSDKATKSALVGAGYSVRDAKTDPSSWSFETSLESYGELLKITEGILAVVPDAHVHQVARLGGSIAKEEGCSLPFTRADAVRPGMVLFDENGGCDVVKTVDRVPLNTTVYDLNVERTHNFIANGLVTHNCIYAWRGAKPEYMTERFEDDFEGATRYKLSRTFRFGHCISLAADHLITHNSARTDKMCISGSQFPWTTIYLRTHMNNESSGVQVMEAVNEWLQKGRKASEIAILVREYAHTLAVEVSLMTTGTAYRLEGAEPALDRRELKAMRGYLMLAAKGFEALDEAECKKVFDAMLVTPTLYLKGDVREAIVNSMTENRSRPEYVLLRAADKAGRAGGQTLREAAEKWTSIARFGPDANAAEVLEEVRALLDLDKYFEKQHAHPETQREKKLMLDEYHRFAQQLDLSVADFCTRIRELMQNVKDGGEDVVLVTSVHRSKGLEWPHVILTELADGKFPAFSGKSPSPEALEEERRLFYVAMTRAQEKLTLVAPWDRELSKSMKDKKGATPERCTMYASRFLYEANLQLSREMGNAIHKGESPRVGYTAMPTKVADRYLQDLETARNEPKAPVLDKAGRRVAPAPISADAPFTPSLF